ncbi:MAG: 3'-5' exonuclease, partial [Anaerolineae bacterium]
SGYAGHAVRNTSTPGSLFIVGDAKQSIYRFRGADVTVFRRVQSDISRAGGRIVPLDLTFRHHRPLLEITNRLLAPILDEVAQPGRLYAVPFAPLAAARTTPRPGIVPPFVEFLLGLCSLADEGRQAAAEALATRLLEMRTQEDIAWEDVALLFRASTTFSIYEDALERAGIPFVTVAGRGFYERYEVRDLLNALLAAADPSDDLALVGFLRSPAIGLTDAALYRLRFPPSTVVQREPHQAWSIWSTLNHSALPEIVPGEDLERAVRGRDLVADLNDLAGRVPVAALLKRLLDRTSYRSALEVVEGGPRALRNVYKLLADAHTSGLVSVREFLEYDDTLRDVGARESEAPTEAGSAVQLMTVHKAKGLEFPIVVIADAARGSYSGGDSVWLDDQLGVTLDVRAGPEDDRRPAVHKLAALRDSNRNEAEERRLLYVAVTRAQEKVLVSGHVKVRKGGALSLNGWLELLGREVGLDEVEIADPPSEPWTLPLAQGIECTITPWEEEPAARQVPALDISQTGGEPARDLVAPLVAGPSGLDPKLREREAQPPRRVWRVVPRTVRTRAPAWVIGTLVHAALRHWRFDDGLDAFLRPFALEAGVVDEAEIRAALQEARRLLRRLRGHPLWAELDAAERWHEVPFSIEEGGLAQHGLIDLVYRAGETWRIVEFKSDRLRSEEEIPAHVREKAYDEQVQRYVRAFRRQLGAKVEGVLVFLNVGNRVVIVEQF